MRTFLEERRVLKLNGNWQPIATITPFIAITNLCGSEAKGPSLKALDIATMTPLSWEQWLELEPLDDTYYIATKSRKIRVPTVVIAYRYRGMPKRSLRFSREHLIALHGRRCAYTDKVLPDEELTVDHVVPRAQRGANTFANTVPCDRKVNLKKGNRTPEQAGLTLIHPPKVPKPLPVCSSIRNPFGIADWDIFLK